jgi:ubiquinone/menaquinone biosynthesis C-methylase UbiE
MKEEKIKKSIRESYGKIAKNQSSCCAPVQSCCNKDTATDISKKLGYADAELETLPEGANLGLGCGNPVALASLKEGETMLDLGSGAGVDCFIAAKKVGKLGKVIGVDMTPEMIDKARENAKKGNFQNVEFRLGEIENLPVADNTADIIISNCVINLVPDKTKVFKEVFRTLKPGGRMMISDIVLTKVLPEPIKNSVSAYVGCLSGAILKDEYLKIIKDVGFGEIKIKNEISMGFESLANDPTAQAFVKQFNISSEQAKGILRSIVSLNLSAVKPN